MKKLILFITGMVCAGIIAGHTQSIPEIRPLHIGDTVPDITLNHIINYKATSATLSDFKGKLVILDFWATWCGSCIAAFPKLDSLQNLYKDKLKILAVTTQNEKIVNDFIKKNKITKNVSLTFVTNDTLLSSLFPHQLVPHEVWISQEGTVKSITSSSEVTQKNIVKAINNVPLKMDQKHDISQENPLFLDSLLPKDKLIHYSIFLKGDIPGLTGGYRQNVTDETLLVSVTNQPILNLYKMVARGEIKNFDEKRMVILVNDNSKIEYMGENYKSNKWIKENLYSYQLIVPIKEKKQIYHYMLDDLNRYSDYNGRIEQRNMPCLILSKINKNKKVFQGVLIKEGGSNNLASQNQPFPTLLSWISLLKFIRVPVVNGVVHTGTIFIDYSKKPHSLDSLQKELAIYNLQLVPAIKKMDMLIFSKKNI